MFRDRPLTWLFIAATIAVDLVLMVAESDQGLISSVKIGLVLGQLAALAIWSVRGQMNRLARISYLVLATGLLTYLIDAIPDLKPNWLAFHTGYVFWIILVTLVGDFLRYRLRKKSGDESPANRWQVPLIEFFGWTTVVAIVSFGARHMDFDFLRQKDAIETIVLLLVVPTYMTLFTRHDLNDLRAVKVLLLALVIMAASVYVARAKNEAEYAVVFQSAYLLLCMPILELEARSRTKAENESTPQQTARPTKPKLFDSQD